MTGWAYSHGLHDLGRGLYAYLQPDGSWGWSNAGLIVDGDETLLVDTLFDEHLTRDMLNEMKRAVAAAADIDVLVNTHANGDHTFGNRVVNGAEIIASRKGAEEMSEFLPEQFAALMRQAPQMGDLGAYLTACFGAFDFEGIPPSVPTRTFDKRLDLKVGDKDVHLIEVGPAHTRGDVMVHVPQDRAIFTGDILFIDGTPIMWQGPVANWIGACDLILGMDLEAIVPGHGPITDKKGVAAVRDYLTYIDEQARKRFDAGMSAEEAARDIALDDFSAWGEAERIAVNVDTLYCDYRGETGTPRDIVPLLALMAKIAR